MSYQPARLNLDLYQNASWTKTLTLHQGDASSAVVNLTGYTASLVVKDTPGGTTLLTLTSSDGITLGGTVGTITLSRTQAQVNALTFEHGVYELTLTSSGGATDVLVYGDLKVVRF